MAPRRPRTLTSETNDHRASHDPEVGPERLLLEALNRMPSLAYHKAPANATDWESFWQLLTKLAQLPGDASS